jgi:hypothetical protein
MNAATSVALSNLRNIKKDIRDKQRELTGLYQKWARAARDCEWNKGGKCTTKNKDGVVVFDCQVYTCPLV